MVELASDFLDRNTPVFRDDVCFFISQSGWFACLCVLWIMFLRQDSHLNSDVCVQERRQTACWLCATVRREAPWRWASPTLLAAPSPEKQTVVFTSMLAQRSVWLAPRWVFFFFGFLIYQVILLLREGDKKWQPPFNMWMAHMADLIMCFKLAYNPWLYHSQGTCSKNIHH